LTGACARVRGERVCETMAPPCSSRRPPDA
jgi:hypothetical protein